MYLTLIADNVPIFGHRNIREKVGRGSCYCAFNGQALGRSAVHRPKLETTVGADGGADFRPQRREQPRQSQRRQAEKAYCLNVERGASHKRRFKRGQKFQIVHATVR